MEALASRLDITQIFCDVDDFCQQFERLWQQQAQLPALVGEKLSSSRMSLSEINLHPKACLLYLLPPSSLVELTLTIQPDLI